MFTWIIKSSCRVCTFWQIPDLQPLSYKTLWVMWNRLPPPPGCIGLLMRGLMGAKPPTVKLVTSLGFGNKRGSLYDREVGKCIRFVHRCSRAGLPLSRLPERGGVLYKQTCLRFQPASCSEEKQILWRCGEFHLHGPDGSHKREY